MLHSTVRRVDYIVALVTTMQDIVRYYTTQPGGMKSGAEDSPFQLVSVCMLLAVGFVII